MKARTQLEAERRKIVDPQVRAQIERALAENRAKGRHRLSVGFLGEGTRAAAISYMAAAPVWKIAYRLVLAREGANARLQGWAVVENLTGGDWNDIELVLVSGNPVTLRQPLYTAFFANRVEVPVTTAVRLRPRTDDADDFDVDTPAGGSGRFAHHALAMEERASMRPLENEIAARRQSAEELGQHLTL